MSKFAPTAANTRTRLNSSMCGASGLEGLRDPRATSRRSPSSRVYSVMIRSVSPSSRRLSTIPSALYLLERFRTGMKLA